MVQSGPRPELPVAPAAERNQAPILGVLRYEFATRSRVLEIGSGTGQHATAFARELRHLRWQPSDVGPDLSAIEDWKQALAVDNVDTPVVLDVNHAVSLPAEFDAAFSANTAHIMSEAEVCRMFDVLGQCLEPGAVFCLYGPFREDGVFNTESNARFDANLRRTNPEMGLRDLERLDEFAAETGFTRQRRYAMPGNNMLLVYLRQGESS